MTVREGFKRYAVSLQYRGPPFLGFSWQRTQEDCILPNGTDLRGRQSVEGRLREALDKLVGRDGYDKIQVSSRTDRGVHALKNTCHIDVRTSFPDESGNVLTPYSRTLFEGLQYYIAKQASTAVEQGGKGLEVSKRRSIDLEDVLSGKERFPAVQQFQIKDMRLLNIREAPHFMDNPLYDVQSTIQPNKVRWDARFSATQRTYLYRILHMCNDTDWAVPFEWNRSWRIRNSIPLDLEAMQRAAKYLTGTHDFTSFRASGCSRYSPVVTLNQICVQSQPYGIAGLSGTFAKECALFGIPTTIDPLCLTTISFQGNSFLYRQVRNMVGYLVAVGKGWINCEDTVAVLNARDRTKAQSTAPAHGLFLVDVKHGDFEI